MTRGCWALNDNRPLACGPLQASPLHGAVEHEPVFGAFEPYLVAQAKVAHRHAEAADLDHVGGVAGRDGVAQDGRAAEVLVVAHHSMLARNATRSGVGMASLVPSK